MIKTILAVALMSVAAHAQQQNSYLSNLQAIKEQKESITFQREQIEQDRKILEAAKQGLEASEADVAQKKSGILFARIMSVGGTAFYGIPAGWALYKDTMALFKGTYVTETALIRALGFKQVILGMGFFASNFAVDQFDRMYVLVQTDKWPEMQANLSKQQHDLQMKENVLKRTEMSLQQRIDSMSGNGPQ